ncbi:MAG: hypothetical protein ACLVJ6_00755 [Merdibacter sp.]
MGMIFQHFNVFPHLTVLENITLATLELGQSKKKHRRTPVSCWPRSVCWIRKMSIAQALRRTETASGHRAGAGDDPDVI